MKRFCFFGPLAMTTPWMERDNCVLLNMTFTFKFVMHLANSRLVRSLGT